MFVPVFISRNRCGPEGSVKDNRSSAGRLCPGEYIFALNSCPAKYRDLSSRTLYPETFSSEERYLITLVQNLLYSLGVGACKAHRHVVSEAMAATLPFLYCQAVISGSSRHGQKASAEAWLLAFKTRQPSSAGRFSHNWRFFLGLSSNNITG